MLDISNIRLLFVVNLFIKPKAFSLPKLIVENGDVALSLVTRENKAMI